MKMNASKSLVALSLTMGLAACGPKLQSVSGNQDGSADPNASRRETVTIGVDVVEKNASLNLAGATSYAMSLDGCASGLTVNSITDTNPSVDVYKFDQGCKVKLNSFTLSGLTFNPSTTDPFTTWVAGDVATFEQSGNTSNKYTVVVTSQLNDPITGTESVAYTFTQLVAGTDETIAKSVVGASHALSVSGQDAANVDITGVTMTGMTAGGAGEFTFAVECLAASTGTAPALSCGANALQGLKYVLVKDTYGGTLTYAQADALFTSGTPSVVASGDIFATGNGGFNALVTSPDQMHNNPNMLFVVQAGGASYKYFNVDVTTLTYP